MSYIAEKEIFLLQDRCLAQGDAACHFQGRTREEWGEKHAAELAFYDRHHLKECLDVSQDGLVLWPQPHNLNQHYP